MSIIISSGESSNGIIVENDSLTISFGGQATETTANDKGGVRVYGAADTTTINEGGSMFVYQDGVAGSTTVNAGGRMYVNSGGTASAVAIGESGFVDVSSGGTAVGVEAAEGGSLCFAAVPNTDVQWTRGGSSFEMKNGTVSDFTWTTGRIQVSSGGMVDNVTLNSGGVIWVSSGGIASYAAINANGRINVSKGGVATWTTVNENGDLRLEGGTAENITINTSGHITVMMNGTAVNTIINDGGYGYVSSTGVASSVKVKAGGRLYVSGGASLTGKMTIDSGAIVSAYENAVINFDITKPAADEDALINDLSLVKGAPTYTLTVSGSQAEGTYTLAAGATGFTGTITVQNTYGADLGTLKLDEKVYIGKDDYTLTLTDDVLTVAINAPTVTTADGDVLLENAMPQARYMYGCVNTSIAMMLGYYDLYGYRGKDLSDVIEGDVDLESRGTGNDIYMMDDFDSVLGRANASRDYVERFFSKDPIELINARTETETTPAEELPYSFVNDGAGTVLRTDVWNCLADYLGTGQFWRGNKNLSATSPFDMLEAFLNDDTPYTVTDEATGIERTIDEKYNSCLYGLYLYVRDKGFDLDRKTTKILQADVAGGEFTFDDYRKEIDAGRPVMVLVTGHAMVGYGYNAETREIIIDNCYQSDQRMVWDGVYDFAGERTLEAICTFGFMTTDADIDLAVSPFDEDSGAAGKLIVATTEGKLVSEDYCFLGSPLYLSFAVSNLGTSATGPFDTSIYFDGELKENIPSMTLDAETVTRLRNVPLAADFGLGLHSIGVRIDPDNEIQEMYALNNFDECSLMVLKEGTNVVEGTRTVAPGEVSKDDYVMNGAGLQVMDGGTAENTLIQGKVTSRSATGEVEFTPGIVNVSKGGLVKDATVYEYGQLQLSGTAENTIVFENGNMVIFSGGVASDISVDENATLNVEAGGTVTGQVRLEKDAKVTFEDGATLDFDLTGATAGVALVNDLSLIQGTPQHTLTVSGTEAEGLYLLADGAAEFTGTLSVVNAAGDAFGDLAFDGTVQAGDNDYTLNLTDGTLSVTVSEVVVEKYEFLVNGERLAVRKDFADGAVFDTITLTTEQLNSFAWANAEEGVAITVNGIALTDGKCDFALTEISGTNKIQVQVTQGEITRNFSINTLNSHLPPITVEGTDETPTAHTPGDFFLSFISTRTIMKTDNTGKILYYRNEDSPNTQYGLWDFKTHYLNGKTFYSYHSTESHPESIVFTGHNPGERVIMDENYNVIARVRAVATEKNGGDTTLDGHDFIMLDEEHYIVLSYLQVEADNIPDVNIYTGEPIKHADKAILVATYIQEIDHGEVKFDWLSTDHPELYSMTVTDETEGAADFTNTDPEVYVDYVHLNAIVLDDDGNLVVSCRHLDSMIKIDRKGGTGDLLWALSGVGDDFGLTDDQKTSGQHFLRYLGNGYFSAFNNNNDKGPTDLVRYHLNEDKTALIADDGFRSWVVPGTTQFEPETPCPPHDTYACGSFQLIGDYGVAGWGWNISGNELVSEFKLSDPTDITFQMRSGYSKEGAYATYRVVKCLSAAPEITLTQQAASWSRIEGSSGYELSLELKGAENALRVGYSGNACDLYNLPNGEYVAKVKEIDFDVSSAESSSVKVEDNLAAAAIVSTENGIDDLFFAKAGGTWTKLFFAQNVGSVNDWAGTGERISVKEKNRIADLFFGSNDANILCLTDDENGDAIVLDDEFTDLPESITKPQSRIAQIDEIRAGAGNDIVDMTSQKYEYIGDGLTIRGGDGNDVIWANKGSNFLFGDAGNDRIAGASGNDVIVGGIGSDRMHGGGGNDVFTFCDNWGQDSVQQLETGTVTLWFRSGAETNWNAETLTYTDGKNSVTVKGVTADKITLKFGSDGSEQYNALAAAGAFTQFTSQKIFEESEAALLASL